MAFANCFEIIEMAWNDLIIFLPISFFAYFMVLKKSLLLETNCPSLEVDSEPTELARRRDEPGISRIFYANVP